MKRFLYKAKALILIFSLVSMLFILGSMAFFVNVETTKPFPQLSNDCVIGEISFSESEDKVYDSLINEGIANNNQFILASQLNSVNSVAIYYTNPELFSINLASGRIFNSNDFINHYNVVIVSEEVRTTCDVRDGDVWWRYAGGEYKVIGVYKKQELHNGFANNCYISLLSSNLNQNVFSNFIFDAKVDSAKMFEQISQSLKIKYQDVIVDYVPFNDLENGEYLNRGTNYKSMELMLIITAVLVLINSISVSINWLLWYKKEIAVRKLCGAGSRSINMWIIRKYAFYIVVSGVVGFVAANLFVLITKYLPVSESTSLMFGNRVTIRGVFGGMGCVFILCGIIVAVILYLYNKKKISEIIR